MQISKSTLRIINQAKNPIDWKAEIHPIVVKSSDKKTIKNICFALGYYFGGYEVSPASVGDPGEMVQITSKGYRHYIGM